MNRTLSLRTIARALAASRPSLGAHDWVWHNWQNSVNSIARAAGIAQSAAEYDEFIDICFGRKP